MYRIISMIIILQLCCAVSANEIYIASGAGYKRPVNEIVKKFEAENDIAVSCIYGNMKQVIAQSKTSGKISLMIGDSSFLQKSGIKFTEKQKLGAGRLVLAFPKSGKIKSLDDLLKSNVKKIILPDREKAIYGRAAFQALNSMSVYDRLESEKKLLVVQTVPQVTAYLNSGAADAGFLNITDCLALDKNRFAYLEIDQKLYSRIIIECGLTENSEESAELFFEYLKSDSAREIFTKYGLGE